MGKPEAKPNPSGRPGPKGFQSGPRRIIHAREHFPPGAAYGSRRSARGVWCAQPGQEALEGLALDNPLVALPEKSIGSDDEERGKPHSAQFTRQRISPNQIRVEDGMLGDPVPNFVHSGLVHRHPVQDNVTVVTMGLVKGVQNGDLKPARGTPCGPEIEYHDLAGEAVQAHDISTLQSGEDEIRCRGKVRSKIGPLLFIGPAAAENHCRQAGQNN